MGINEVDQMMTDILGAMDFVLVHKESLNELHIHAFEALVCMLMEEYCKANGLDVVEEATKLAVAVESVNEALGKYGEEEEE